VLLIPCELKNTPGRLWIQHSLEETHFS
jgi:hypothetical protein